MAGDAAALRRTFRHAKAGINWRISVNKRLWPIIPIATERVCVRFKRWLNKEVGDARIAWEYGNRAQNLDELIEHGLQCEGGEKGEPAPELLTSSPVRRARRQRQTVEDPSEDDENQEVVCAHGYCSVRHAHLSSMVGLRCSATRASSSPLSTRLASRVSAAARRR
mmetsp:Transcript_23154/g.62790  ORF Transcript_23154/g.62790 Transcript_23154/m.62790 type:complete len:166 (+) Transcript_23154:82-579(+)